MFCTFCLVLGAGWVIGAVPLHSGAHLRAGAGPGAAESSRCVPGDGAFPSPPPTDLPSLWLFRLRGNIFREREAAFPDYEPCPAEPSAQRRCPALGREARLAGAGRTRGEPGGNPGGTGALPPLRDKTPLVSHRRAGLRAPRLPP